MKNNENNTCNNINNKNIKNIDKQKNNTIKSNNKNEILEMKESKENEIILKSNIIKVDEGTNVNMSLNKNYSNYNIKDKNLQFKVMANERISFVNYNKNKEKDYEKKILSSDYKIGNQLSINYNSLMISNNNDNNKIKNKKYIKRNTINNLLNSKKYSIDLNKTYTKISKFNKNINNNKLDKNKICKNNLISKNKLIKTNSENENFHKKENKTELVLVNKNKTINNIYRQKKPHIIKKESSNSIQKNKIKVKQLISHIKVNNKNNNKTQKIIKLI